MTNNKNNSFLCKIADLIVQIPDIEGIYPLCKDYLYEGEEKPDIVIDEKAFKTCLYPEISIEDFNYVEVGRLFNANLLKFDGFYLHSSAIELDGKAYLFSGDSGAGKSTHTGNWKKMFGDRVRYFNDDKPTLRKIDGVWYAYGTPWCGKDHININTRVPIAGICFLKQAPHNSIRRLSVPEAVNSLLVQTICRFNTASKLDFLVTYITDIVRTIPIFELENLPDEEAVKLSYNTMLNAAKEAGL